MGPSLAHRARRAADQSGLPHRIIAASRFASGETGRQLAEWGIEAIPCDLLDRDQIAHLPSCANVLFLAGRKFGSTENMPLTWATNTLRAGFRRGTIPRVPHRALSSGNVYPLAVTGATEETTPAPVGESAQSALGRERVFEYFSRRDGTPVAHHPFELRHRPALWRAARYRPARLAAAAGTADHGIGECHLAGRCEFHDLCARWRWPPLRRGS